MKQNRLLLITWWCFAAALFLLTQVGAKTAKRDAIAQQLARVRYIQDESGMRLSNNEEFHDWLMITSSQRMPQRLELFYTKLNKSNMRRRLFYIYKWQTGRREASRSQYAAWLSGLADWFENYAVSDEAQNRIQERKEKAQAINEALMNKKKGIKNGETDTTEKPDEKATMNGKNEKNGKNENGTKKNE